MKSDEARYLTRLSASERAIYTALASGTNYPRDAATWKRLQAGPEWWREFWRERGIDITRNLTARKGTGA